MDKEEQDEARLPMEIDKMNLLAAEQFAPDPHADADMDDHVEGEERAQLPSNPSQAHDDIEK